MNIFFVSLLLFNKITVKNVYMRKDESNWKKRKRRHFFFHLIMYVIYIYICIQLNIFRLCKGREEDNLFFCCKTFRKKPGGFDKLVLLLLYD